MLPWLAWGLAEAGSQSFLFKITFSFAFSGHVCVGGPYVHVHIHVPWSCVEVRG